MDTAAKGKLVPAPVWPRPMTEWPTVLIYVTAMPLFAISTYLGIHSPYWLWPVFVLLNAACIYAMFTVIHEASHHNITRRFPRLEYFMGFSCGILFHGSFEQFIALHMRHHAKVNVQGEDPDLHAVGPITLKRLLIWGGTVIWYFKFYLEAKMYRKQRSWRVAMGYLVIGALYLYGWQQGWLVEMLSFWLLPAFLGVIFTAYVFDHLPHVPHADPGRYTNARVYPKRGRDWVYFMQSHHLVHHLWPSVPWYRYRECYQQRREELLQAGARETVL